MKINTPVTQIETAVKEGKTLVSRTDLKGVITEANSCFVEVSGFSREELMGSSHNIVRHPDVPPIVFEDLWKTLQSGRPWTQVVKNRCKNGNHYWVEANVTPVFEGGKIAEYMSVRRAATREQIALAEQAYQKIEQGKWSISEGNVSTSKWQERSRRWNILKGLKVSQKLALIVIMMFVIVGGLLGTLYSSEMKQIEFRDQERKGVEVIQSLRGLAEHLPKHRGMGNAFLNGDSSFRGKIDQVEKRIADDFGKAAQTATQVSRVLVVEDELQQLEKGWQYLKGDWNKQSAAESFASHTRLIGELLDFVVLIGDRSNLILDPDLDTFYLIDVMVNRGLQLADITGQLRGMGSGVVARGARTERDLERIISLKLQGELLIKGLQKSVRAAAGANASTRQLLLAEMEQLDRAVAEWGQMVAVLAKGDLTTLTPSGFFAAGTAMIDVIFAVFDRSAVQLMSLLNERIEAGERVLFWSAVITGVMALLLVWIVWRLVRSISGPLNQAGETLMQIASGNYRNQITYSGKDEIAQMLAGLKAMQIKAGADLDEIIENANETSRIKIALDGASTNVMIADHNRRIIYLNPAVIEMLRKNEQAIRKDLPNFRVDDLQGSSMDQFHKRPEHQAQILDGLTDTFRTQVQIGGRIFNLAANPVINGKGERLGTSVEWRDVTEQILAEEMLEKLVNGAVDGDLTRRLDSSNFEGFMQRMAGSINGLMDTFDGVLAQTRVVIEQVNESVGQIRMGSQDLATATEEQSSAIEQVSTSMEETDSQVKSNAQNANVANQLVQETNTVADAGQQKMAEMIESMGEISNSSQDIAKIIKVIDEIAFQTNLLALNAAVEAARAGKYGKGFAVVAQEVRDLAGRSAEAAKETAELIEQSTAQVTEGVKVADATAESLEGIVGNVVKVRDLVAEISTASEEQTKGIVQINDAMSQISDGAQSGSQQSMEMASAADQLASLTDQLATEIARFRLKGAMSGVQSMAPAPSKPVAEKRVAREPQVPAVQQPQSILPLDQDERDFGDF